MMTGAVKPVFRLPYVPLNEQQQAQGVTLINQLDGVAVVGGSKATPLNLENTIILP